MSIHPIQLIQLIHWFVGVRIGGEGFDQMGGLQVDGKGLIGQEVLGQMQGVIESSFQNNG